MRGGRRKVHDIRTQQGIIGGGIFDRLLQQELRCSTLDEARNNEACSNDGQSGIDPSHERESDTNSEHWHRREGQEQARRQKTGGRFSVDLDPDAAAGIGCNEL